MHIAYEGPNEKRVGSKARSSVREEAWHAEGGRHPGTPELIGRQRAYMGAHLLEVIFTSVGVFRYFRVAIGTCSSLPVMSALVLSFQVAPSEKVTRRFMLHR